MTALLNAMNGGTSMYDEPISTISKLFSKPEQIFFDPTAIFEFSSERIREVDEPIKEKNIVCCCFRYDGEKIMVSMEVEKNI